MLVLPKSYRFKVYNQLGQTISAGNVTCKGLRYKIGSDGAIAYESSEATLLSNAGTLATATYLAGTSQDNSSDKWVGGDFTFKVIAPASSSGAVTLFLERSSDGGTTWDDDGLGIPVARLDFTTSGTKVVTFSI
jgi:hypothetical protein